jgi:RNA polymerase sigma factor (sigma-70 family)
VVDQSWNEISDDVLMSKASAGDSLAFDRIVKRHQHRLQRFAVRMLGAGSDRAPDMAVAAFLRLWEKRHAFEARNVEGWLLRACYWLCLDEIAAHRQFEVFDDLPSSDEAFEASDLASAVKCAVAGLPEPLRAVLILSSYEGLSYEEISLALGIPTGTVASRKSSALQTLRRKLAAWKTHDEELDPQILNAWSVSTVDVSGRVSSIIAAEHQADIGALRDEVRRLTQATAHMHEELLRLRMELSRQSLVRLSRAPAEQLVRLS